MFSFLKAFQFAFRGIRFAWSGRNFRVQCAAALAVIALGMLFGISKTEWLVLALIIGMVLCMEVMNSAIEEIVNFVSPELNPVAGRIKDLAAGAVLLVAISSVIIGLIIFYPYLMTGFVSGF